MVTENKLPDAVSAAEKRRRREKWKLERVADLARRFDIAPDLEYNFKKNTPEHRYLDSLEKQIYEQRLTLIRRHKLWTIRHCVEACLQKGLPGDLIETGVWKGGACIYMAGLLHIYGDTSRKIFVADSFEGLPPPDTSKWPVDSDQKAYQKPELAVSLDDVRSNFEKFGLLGDNIVFVKGFFKDSLSSVEIDKLAILRLDGDMYGSTMTVLQQP